jgi:tRNA(fMet)-specific endonuclease VapC
MPARFMLDTNIVSYLLRDQIPALKARFLRTPSAEVAVSTITEAEVQFGIARKPGAAKLRLAAENFLAGIAVFPWDSAAARAYGPLRAEQERKGRPLSLEGLMIAAHALSLGLVLITNDQAFRFVQGLKTEDWTLP